MDELTVEQMEAYVRAAWVRVVYGSETKLIFIEGVPWEAFVSWQAAYVFTKAVEAEVLERREEIAEQARVIGLARVSRQEYIEAVHERILKRLQASLAELQRGMKEVQP